MVKSSWKNGLDLSNDQIASVKWSEIIAKGSIGDAHQRIHLDSEKLKDHLDLSTNNKYFMRLLGWARLHDGLAQQMFKNYSQGTNERESLSMFDLCHYIPFALGFRAAEQPEVLFTKIEEGETLGHRLRTIRTYYSLTQSVFAGWFSVDQTIVSKWENNEVSPPYEALAKYGYMADCPVDHILNYGFHEFSQKGRFYNKPVQIIGWIDDDGEILFFDKEEMEDGYEGLKSYRNRPLIFSPDEDIYSLDPNDFSGGLISFFGELYISPFDDFDVFYAGDLYNNFAVFRFNLHSKDHGVLGKVIRKHPDGNYDIVSPNGKILTGIKVIEIYKVRLSIPQS